MANCCKRSIVHRDSPCFVLLSVIVVLVFVVGTTTIRPLSVSAQDDLLPRLERALEDAGATVLDADDSSLEGVWSLTVQYGGAGGTIQIEKAQNAQEAQQIASSFSSTAAGGKSTTINGVPAKYLVSTAQSAGQQNSQTSLWWARDKYFVFMYLVSTDDIGPVRQLGEVVDDVLSGADGTGGGTGDASDETVVEEALSVSVSPVSFKALGDSVEIEVTLTGADPSYKDVTLTGHGLDRSAVTDARGRTSFTVTHTEEALSEYRFRIGAEGLVQEVRIPVLAIDIRPEIAPATGEPYAGVAADGVSVLVIEVDLGVETGGTLNVEQPELGSLGGAALRSDGTVDVSGGTATLEYTPPAYLGTDVLTEEMPSVPADGPGSQAAQPTVFRNGSPWAAVVPLAFTYTDSGGERTPITVDVRVVRPPVMLVHGFTGDKTTWTSLQSYLKDRRFDAVINEYYRGDQGIHDQARGLGEDIRRETDRYSSLGLKIARVDVVGHSMGGLIARDYTWGFEPHPTDVRKIIMVGTPNHGANFLDKTLGNLAAEFGGTHNLASEQLYSGSAFMRDLNRGEDVGRHLNPDIQYGNIYGELTDYVVPNTSAYLNGVTSHGISGVTHSAAIPLPGVPITESDTVFGWVTDWLVSDIPRARLRSTSVEVVKGEGGVFLSGVDTNGKETREDLTAFPKAVQAWEEIGTESDGRARIRLSVAGLAWGTLDLAPDSQIAIGNVTPHAVTVRVRRGSARFRSLRRSGGGHFQVVIGEQPAGEWYTFHPDAKVIGLDTEFVVRADDSGEAEVLVLDGRALFSGSDAVEEADALTLESGQAAAVGVVEGYESTLAEDQWWTDGFYRPSLLEVLQEWWSILRSAVASMFEADAAAEPVVIAE